MQMLGNRQLPSLPAWFPWKFLLLEAFIPLKQYLADERLFCGKYLIDVVVSA